MGLTLEKTFDCRLNSNLRSNEKTMRLKVSQAGQFSTNTLPDPSLQLCGEEVWTGRMLHLQGSSTSQGCMFLIISGSFLIQCLVLTQTISHFLRYMVLKLMSHTAHHWQASKPKVIEFHFLFQFKLLEQWVKLYIAVSVTFLELFMQLINFPGEKVQL